MKLKKIDKLYMYGFWASFILDRSIWINFLQHYDISNEAIGFLQTSLTLTMFLFEMPSGVLTDKYGAKKVMYAGHLLIAVYMLSMFFHANFATLLLGFLSYGIGLSLISGSDQTLIYNHNSKLSYQKKIGNYMAVCIVALTISSLLGGFLSTISWESIFMVTLLAQGVAVLLLHRVTAEPKIVTDQDNKERIRLKTIYFELFQVFKEKEVKYLVLSIAIFQGSLSTLFNFVQLLLSIKNFQPFESATLLTVALALSAIAAVSIEKISTRLGAKKAFSLFLTLTAFSLAAFFSQSMIVIIFGFILMRFCFEFVDTSLNAMIHECAKNDVRTSLISGVNTLTAGLMFLESALVTFLFSKFDVSFSYISLGLVAVVLTALFYFIFVKVQRKRRI